MRHRSEQGQAWKTGFFDRPGQAFAHPVCKLFAAADGASFERAKVYPDSGNMSQQAAIA
jgi:hypothetical protein